MLPVSPGFHPIAAHEPKAHDEIKQLDQVAFAVRVLNGAGQQLVDLDAAFAVSVELAG
ncbi:hypothetical protein FQZ97_1096910 [compost metagenome]